MHSSWHFLQHAKKNFMCWPSVTSVEIACKNVGISRKNFSHQINFKFSNKTIKFSRLTYDFYSEFQNCTIKLNSKKLVENLFLCFCFWDLVKMINCFAYFLHRSGDLSLFLHIKIVWGMALIQNVLKNSRNIVLPAMHCSCVPQKRAQFQGIGIAWNPIAMGGAPWWCLLQAVPWVCVSVLYGGGC